MKRKGKCHEGYKESEKRIYCKRRNISKRKAKLQRRKRKVKKTAKKTKKTKTKPSPLKKLKGSSRYIIYCIANCGFLLSKGNLSASVARGLLGLYNKVDQDRLKSKILQKWECTGENLIILKGINHKHLMYLENDVHLIAVDTFVLYQVWGRHEIALVLAVLGSKEKLEMSLGGLSHLN